MKVRSVSGGLMRTVLLAGAMVAPWGLVQARTPDANALFDWAEKTYSPFFTGHPVTEDFPPYVFRHYDNGNFLAIADEKLYLLGPLTANQLQALGSVTQFSCFVYPAECGQTPPGSLGTELQEVTTFLAEFDALWAKGVPADGTAATSLSDGCYLKDGYSKAMDIATINADLADWRGDSAYRVGARRINPTILAVRSSINTDGSSRREMDIQYDVSYSDGTTDSAVLNTLISGSSSGSCLTPQTGNNLRWFGNRQRAAFTALGRNLIYRNYKLSDGSLTSTQVRREIAFAVKDPAGIATYAIVTGAGPTTNSGTTVIPFSLKLLSPRILRSDTLMAGKRGNFTNWLDTDTFRTCRTAASSAPPAALADCAGQGAGGWSYGYTYTTSASTTLSLLMSADSSFNGYGFGGRYTVALYNDDGWKTVNGHAGRTPVATYTSDLPQLPFSFASMAIGSDMTAKYPAITSMNPTIAGLASLLRGGASGQVDVQWTAPIPPDGSAFRVSELGEYYEGPLSSNPTGTFYPAQRSYISNYPGSSSLRSVAPITAKPATVGSKTSGDLEVWYSNRNGGRIGLVHSYQ